VSLSLPTVKSAFGLTHAEQGIRFVPNYMSEKLDEPFDIVINTLSMSEMTVHQVGKYANLIKTWIKNNGIFFEQNQDNRHLGLLFAQEILSTKFREHVSLNKDAVVLRGGHPNIWANRKIHLEEKWLSYGPVRALLLEDIGDFNVVQVRNKYFCLKKTLGPIDATKLPFEDVPPNIFVGASKEEACGKATRGSGNWLSAFTEKMKQFRKK